MAEARKTTPAQTWIERQQNCKHSPIGVPSMFGWYSRCVSCGKKLSTPIDYITSDDSSDEYDY